MHRKVQWHDSFGGGPINLPSVKQQSTIDKNTEKVRNIVHTLDLEWGHQGSEMRKEGGGI